MIHIGDVVRVQKANYMLYNSIGCVKKLVPDSRLTIREFVVQLRQGWFFALETELEKLPDEEAMLWKLENL